MYRRIFLLFSAALLVASPAFAMHITEGILPAPWAGLWFLLAAPFFFWGLRDITVKSKSDLRYKSLVALVGAAVFIISCMPVPVPVVGTCSHPAGTGLAALLIGPAATVVVSSIALTLQALFLAHGGLTTLGANLFSMGIAGAFVSYGVFLLARRLRVPLFWAAFMAGLTADWATYTLTSVELASAFQGAESFSQLFTTILIAFSPTQIPLGILEGFLTAIAYQFLCTRLQLGVCQKTEVRSQKSEDRSQKSVIIALLCFALATPAFCEETNTKWAGVDETVIEKYAEAAGRSAREPLINTDQGDLLLFVFLLAGALGGFVAGYAYRSLALKKRTFPLAILLGSLACVNPCHAQEGHVEQHAPHQHIHPPSEEPLSYEVILGINSMDIWNGMVGYDHPFAHVAPRIAYDQETLGTFAMGADFLYPMGSPRPSKCGGLSEMDVALSWDRSFGPVNLQLGTTYYSIMPDHRDDLYEGFVGLRYENKIVVPYLVGYYDFNQTDGTYFKGGLCRTFKLMERLSADIDLCCGYGLPAYNRSYFASNHATFTDATAQLILQYDVTSNLYIGGTAAFTMLLDNAIRNSQFVNDTYGTVDNFWFGLHVGVHF